MKKLFYLFTAVLYLFIFNSCSTESTPIYQLNTAAEPSQSGTVSPFSGEFDEGETAEISALANDGWIFEKWQGGHTGTNNPTSVTMNQDKQVTALFVKIEHALNKEVQGEGDIYERIIQAKTTTHEPGTVVEVIAVPDEGWKFSHWGTDLDGIENPTTLIMDGEKTVTAVFELDFEPSNNRIAWYPFSGNANDESGNGNHGTVRGTVSLTTDRHGNENSAYLFPGNSSSYINVASNSTFSGLSIGITVSIWYLADTDYADHHRLLQIGNTDTGSRGLEINARRNIYRTHINSDYPYNEGGRIGTNGTVEIENRIWSQLIFSADFNNGNWKVYSNGELVDSGNTENPVGFDPLNLSDLVFNIGMKAPSGANRDGWIGKLDDIAIWDRALTNEEAEALYISEKP